MKIKNTERAEENGQCLWAGKLKKKIKNLSHMLSYTKYLIPEKCKLKQGIKV
jgi:hypothetical protein